MISLHFVILVLAWIFMGIICAEKNVWSKREEITIGHLVMAAINILFAPLYFLDTFWDLKVKDAKSEENG